MSENDLNIKEINQSFIVYSVQSNFIERLNLAFELKFKLKNNNSDDLFILDYSNEAKILNFRFSENTDFCFKKYYC